MFRRKKKSTKTISKSNKNQDSKSKSASKTSYRQKANDLICVGRGGLLAHGAQLPGHRHEFVSEFEN